MPQIIERNGVTIIHREGAEAQEHMNGLLMELTGTDNMEDAHMAFVGRWRFIASNDSYVLSRRTKECHQAADKSMRLERFAIAFGYINLPNLAGPPIDILEQVTMNPLKLIQCSLGARQLPVEIWNTRGCAAVRRGGIRLEQDGIWDTR